MDAEWRAALSPNRNQTIVPRMNATGKKTTLESSRGNTTLDMLRDNRKSWP